MTWDTMWHYLKWHSPSFANLVVHHCHISSSKLFGCWTVTFVVDIVFLHCRWSVRWCQLSALPSTPTTTVWVSFVLHVNSFLRYILGFYAFIQDNTLKEYDKKRLEERGNGLENDLWSKSNLGYWCSGTLSSPIEPQHHHISPLVLTVLC